MGRLFVISLEGSIYSCKHCHTHLGLADDIISKSFRCRHGKASLFDKVVNITVGEKEERMMLTGMHTVVDIFCVGCGSVVGWKYGHYSSRRVGNTRYYMRVSLTCRIFFDSLDNTKDDEDEMLRSSAQEKAQKYKEGKFILERYKVLGPDQAVGER